MITIDIIIVNFNAGMHLTNCVKSVLNSTLPVNIFISDNGSTDNSLELLQQAIEDRSNIFIQKNQANLGFSRGNNLVFDKTSSEYLLYLNPDCLLEPETLANLVKEFDRRAPDTDNPVPRIGMIGCLIKNIDGSEQVGCRRRIPTPWLSLIHLLCLHRWLEKYTNFQDFILTNQALPPEPIVVEGISGAFMLVKREAIQEVGLLDENYFLHCEDLDWFMRFRLSNWSILFVPHIAITHLKGMCSQATPYKVLWHKHRGMMFFYKKFFLKRYNLFLMSVVSLGIWLRFLLLVVHQLIQRCHRQRRTGVHQLTDNVTDTHIT